MVKRKGVAPRPNGVGRWVGAACPVGVARWVGVARRIRAPRRPGRTIAGPAALLGLVLLANAPPAAAVVGVGADHAEVGGAPAELARGASGERLLYSIDETLPHLRGSDRTPLGAFAGSRAAASASAPAPARADTVSFGFYETREDGLKYAVRGETWTFDHGTEDPFEGWTSIDLSENLRDYWRQVTEASWLAEGNPLPWPQMAGEGMVLCGSRSGEADSLGWTSGIGYGNDWCQRLTSPVLVYDGSGSVDLAFHYFNDTEADYDYSRVFAKGSPYRRLLNDPGFNGKIGIDTLGIITPRSYTRAISNAELGGGTDPREFTVIFEFFSDAGLSDEDGRSGWDSFYGAWGIDDVVIGGNLVPDDTLHFGFETGLEGWTAARCPGVGRYLGIAPVTAYNILDPCACGMAGNLLEMYSDGSLPHPDLQNEMAFTPIVDRRADLGDPGYLEYNRIFAEWDMYAYLPMENGTYYRTGWSYYPYEDPDVPGLVRWSPRIGHDTWFSTGGDPLCLHATSVGTDWGLPPTAEQVRFIFELYCICDPSGTGAPCANNETPFIDNIRIRNTQVPIAPAITFDAGGRFQDGYGQSPLGRLSPTDPGNANASRDLRPAIEPARLVDSLSVTGPPTTSTTRWEAKLWFRLKRLGPGQTSNATFATWRNALAGSPGKPATFWGGINPPFTWGYMDSVEVGTQAAKNKFCSQFRDGPSPGGQNLPPDPDFNWGGGGEQGEGNEILPDLAFTPGTQVEYFISSNYTCSPGTYWLLPDTAGGHYEEFEILPSYRLDSGVPQFPCILYVDAENLGAQAVIEQALNLALNGAAPGTPIPNPAPWDRYDYLDAASNWNAPLYRDANGNNGAALLQLLGYRAILFSTGQLGPGATEAQDWQGIRTWLETMDGEANTHLQGFIANGTRISEIVDDLDPGFLAEVMGAAWTCSNYAQVGCPPGETVPDNDQQYCVQLAPVPGGPFSPSVPIDVYGNWCPLVVEYAVVQPTGTGQGNKQWERVGDNDPTSYAQITNDRNASFHKYRTVLDAWSYDLLAQRDLDVAPDPDLECPSDAGSVVPAAAAEFSSAIRWILNISNPLNIGLCMEPPVVEDAPETPPPVSVTALYPPRPNPFNPRTTIRYSLAAAGPATIEIFDVQGRRVRRLIHGPQTAGPHEVIWDSTNDAGRKVGAGVYWYRLSAPGYTSNRRMVVVP